MESPVELLAALPALVTVLALLLAWLLLRRGPAPAPESTPPAEAPGAPAPPEPPEPCAPEPAPAGPCQSEPVAEPGESEAEEPAAEGRQVRTEVAVGSPGGHLRACWPDLPRKGRASGRQERRVPAAGTIHPPPKCPQCLAVVLSSLPPRRDPPGPPKALDTLPCTLLLPRFCPPLPKSTNTCPTSRSGLELAYS